MAWTKLDASFSSHPKFRALARRLGVSPVTARGHCATLWSWCVLACPDGDLGDMDDEHIALAADWDGDPALFVTALVDVLLLDRGPHGLLVHGWMERHSSHLESHRRAARRMRARASSSSPDVSADCPPLSADTPGLSALVRGQARTNPDCPPLSADKPGLSALRGEERRREYECSNELDTHTSSSRPNSTALVLHADDASGSSMAGHVQAVVGHYRTYHPRYRGGAPGSPQERLILKRLQEGHSVADLIQAIDGCHRSPHHIGLNDRGTKYQSLELIMRNADKVAAFIALADGPLPTYGMSPREIRDEMLREQYRREDEANHA